MEIIYPWNDSSNLTNIFDILHLDEVPQEQSLLDACGMSSQTWKLDPCRTFRASKSMQWHFRTWERPDHVGSCSYGGSILRPGACVRFVKTNNNHKKTKQWTAEEKQKNVSNTHGREIAKKGVRTETDVPWIPSLRRIFRTPSPWTPSLCCDDTKEAEMCPDIIMFSKTKILPRE